MAQVPRISSLTVESVEEAQDIFEEIAARGRFCPQELMEVRFALDRALFAAARADLATAISVCVSRGGPHGARFQDLVRQYDQLDSMEAASKDAPIAAADPLGAA